MTRGEALRVVELWQPQKTWLTGAEQAAVLAYAGPTPDPNDEAAVTADEFTPTSLARGLGSTSNHAYQRMFTARKLSEEFTDLGDRLRAATLDPYRVGIILDTLLTFDHLPHALAVQSRTKLRKTLRRLAREVDPGWNTQMFTNARKTRRVVFDDLGDDGLLGMHAYFTPVEGLAVQQHLLKLAHVPSPDPQDARSVDERMCDALAATVLGTTPGDPTTPLPPKVLVNVFVDEQHAPSVNQ